MNSEYRNRTSPHHTVIFRLGRSMDDTETVRALGTLGVPLSTILPPGSSMHKHAVDCRSWMACGLRSDGVVELWAAKSSDCPISGSLEQALETAGFPYEIYRPWPGCVFRL